MSKKIAKVLLVLITLVAMTGCAMKENLNMKISSNKNVKITLIAAMDDEMIDTMISMKESGEMPSTDNEKKTYTDEERWKFLESDENDTMSVPDDYNVKKYDKDGFKGYLAEKDLGSIDTMSTEKGAQTDRVNIFSDDEIFEGKLFIKDGTEYTSNMKIDLSESEDGEDMSSYESYGAVFDMKLIIEFPRVPLSHNADEVSADGKTLTWDLLKKKDVEFTFDFKKDGEVVETKKPTDTEIDKAPVKDKKKINILLVAAILGGIMFLGIIAIIVIIILVTRNKPQPVQIQQTIDNPQGTVNSNQKPQTVKVEEKHIEKNITTNNTTEKKVEVTKELSKENDTSQEETTEQLDENTEDTKAE